jgi:hypothetical protein
MSSDMLALIFSLPSRARKTGWFNRSREWPLNRSPAWAVTLRGPRPRGARVESSLCLPHGPLLRRALLAVRVACHPSSASISWRGQIRPCHSVRRIGFRRICRPSKEHAARHAVGTVLGTDSFCVSVRRQRRVPPVLRSRTNARRLGRMRRHRGRALCADLTVPLCMETTPPARLTLRVRS